ncbi:DUF1223 domain-containing protein [Roseovarius sp. SYSU LYC5161]|uniref:DUF1223 domain-containing protein n=1 Tax=Roseovarius halophilus (ex Wu et al. 2025) TaxID=3376060 RepID=UPI00287136C9|nr:DUF1223 domain-containing protein [Roseovarius sp.]
MLKRAVLILVALGHFLTPADNARAGEGAAVVVELFTSQGCSSCPPADAYLRDLAAREDVVALAFHVDYWDYIGWKDSFGDAAHTARQRAYARAAGRRMVYTPQMIVNGAADAVGNRAAEVDALIDAAADQPRGVTLDLTRRGDRVKVVARANGDVSVPLSVRLMRYRPEATVRIDRGENAGRTLDYVNIVHGLRMLEPAWRPAEPFETLVPVTGPDPVAVIIQREGHGPVEAVARID